MKNEINFPCVTNNPRVFVPAIYMQVTSCNLLRAPLNLIERFYLTRETGRRIAKNTTHY